MPIRCFVLVLLCVAPIHSRAQESREPTPRRTRAQVNALIDEVGRTPPDWYQQTPLNYPETLDLSWPQPPPGKWDNKKNVSQFVWDIINPNPGRWKEGVRLMHHLLVVHKDNRVVQQRTMDALGRMYHNLLEDFPRAAFWWRKAGVDQRGDDFSIAAVHLAECYWKLGGKELAVELLAKTPAYPQTIKLWGEMGEIDRALKLADRFAQQQMEVDVAFMYAGDVCRMHGDYARALRYYEQVLTLDVDESGGRFEQNISRAKASIEAIKLFDLSDVRRVADGTYPGNSLGYEGQIHVEVTVKDQRITAVNVTEHKEKQFYSAIADTPRKIIQKQGVKGVDATSSATITSEAIINATAKALAAGAK